MRTPLPVARKRRVLLIEPPAPSGGHRRVPAHVHTATAMSFSHGSGLLFLRDPHSKLNFLVDSGATLSIIPFTSSLTPLGPKLIGANGAQIPTWGFQKQTVTFGSQQFTHDFLLAKVATPILGLDFFRKFQLSIHPLQCQVLDKAGNPLSTLFAAVAAADNPPQQEVSKDTPPRSAAAATAPAAPAQEVRRPLSTREVRQRPLSTAAAAHPAAPQLQRVSRDAPPRSAAAATAPAAPTREVSKHPSTGGTAADPQPAPQLQEVSNSIPLQVRQLLAKYPFIIRSETVPFSSGNS